jgi:Kef-type K+ transport system membrane component KefB
VLGLAETSNIQLLANIGLGFLFLLAGYELDPQLLPQRPPSSRIRCSCTSCRSRGPASAT